MKHAIMTCASENVVHELIPLLNSIDFFDHTCDVIVFYKNLSEKIIKKLQSVEWTFNLIFYPLEYKPIKSIRYNQSLKGEICTNRWSHVAKYGVDYDSVVLLDADMVLTSNINDMLALSSLKYIFGVRGGAEYNFDDTEHAELKLARKNNVIKEYGKHWNGICAVPLFINANEHYDLLTETTKRGIVSPVSDYKTLNYVMHDLKKCSYLMALPNKNWLGTAMSWFKTMVFSQVNPNSCDKFDNRFKKELFFMTENASPVRSMHCHWWNNPSFPEAADHRLKKVFKYFISNTVPDDKDILNYEEKEKIFIKQQHIRFNKHIRGTFLYFTFNGKLPFEEYGKYVNEKTKQNILSLNENK